MKKAKVKRFVSRRSGFQTKCATRKALIRKFSRVRDQAVERGLHALKNGLVQEIAYRKSILKFVKIKKIHSNNTIAHAH